MEVTFSIGAGTPAGTELLNQADVTLARRPGSGQQPRRVSFPHAGPRPQPARHQVVRLGRCGAGQQRAIPAPLRERRHGAALRSGLQGHLAGPYHAERLRVGRAAYHRWADAHLDAELANEPRRPARLLAAGARGRRDSRRDDPDQHRPRLFQHHRGARHRQHRPRSALAVGPDLRVEKELLDEGIRPGHRARYRIRIWNDGHAPGSQRRADRHPADRPHFRRVELGRRRPGQSGHLEPGRPASRLERRVRDGGRRGPRSGRWAAR